MTDEVAVPGRSDVATLFLGIVFVNGAVRQITVSEPLDWLFAVEDSGRPAAGLAPGLDGSAKMEPRFLVGFSGNPGAGGAQVHAEGTPP